MADYRGYGLSSGRPSFASMTADAHSVFNFFLNAVQPTVHSGPLFLMGRSLGSHSTVELASHYPEHIRGLILESGSGNMTRLVSLIGLPMDAEVARGLEEAAIARVRSITVPVLIIHGEWDNIVPVIEAVKFYDAVASDDKRLAIIPSAGHNDIMLVGMEQYFSAIREFVFAGEQ